MTTISQRPNARRKIPVPLIITVVVGLILLLIAVLVLYYENVIITTGPSRKDVTATAEHVLRESTPHLPGHPVLGTATSFYDPCGHGETGPQQAVVGIRVRVTGVPARLHAAFTQALLDQTLEHTHFPTNPDWVGNTFWDSATSTSGTITVGPGCISVARWP